MTHGTGKVDAPRSVDPADRPGRWTHAEGTLPMGPLRGGRFFPAAPPDDAQRANLAASGDAADLKERSWPVDHKRC